MPQQSSEAWVWEIPSGTIYDPTGPKFAQGYSGHDTPTVQGINNVDAIGDVDVGPLPCGPWRTAGEYEIGPLLPNLPSPTNGISHLGPNVAQLIPSSEQRAFLLSLGHDPDSYYLHGGLIGEPSILEPGVPPPTASKGCLILPRAARMVVLQSPVRRLLCVPRWPLPVT